jgi:hypothetical protein
MPQHVRSLALAVALLSSSSLGALAAQGTTEQRQTVQDLRNVGTAMFFWYKDQVKSHPKAAAAAPAVKEDGAPFASVPVISRRELAKLLVPQYIQEVPENDGWGHPYEYRLQTEDLDARHIMGLRSAGRDGRFAGDSYAVGSFPDHQEDEDIVWMDGYFVRWPAPPK